MKGSSIYLIATLNHEPFLINPIVCFIYEVTKTDDFLKLTLDLLRLEETNLFRRKYSSNRLYFHHAPSKKNCRDPLKISSIQQLKEVEQPYTMPDSIY